MRIICRTVLLILTNLICLAALAQPVGQIVTVSSQFNDIIMPAAVWVEIRDPQAGAVRPFFMRLDQRAQSQVFATHSNDFLIHRIWVEFDDGHVSRPCQFTKDFLNKKSVQIMLTGLLDHTFTTPQCHVSYVNTPPIQHQLMSMEQSQQLTTDQPVATEESKYYAALKECSPSAFRFKAYQPFVDDVVETLVIIEGETSKRCVVLKENKFKSAQGNEATAITRCQFTTATLEKINPANINELVSASQNANAAKNTFYSKAMCDDCKATAAGKRLNCFEKFSEEPKIAEVTQ